MYLSRHRAAGGARWALDGHYLPQDFTLGQLLGVRATEIRSFVDGQALGEAAGDPSLPPVEPGHEIWASGVTYLRSREARGLESTDADAYERVYDAERPELFFKALGWRVVGHGDRVRVREDSHWNVPEPELVLVANSRMEIVGYTAGNDVSSRDIEGENPLYLPQAKVYDGSCALGPGLYVSKDPLPPGTGIELRITRGHDVVFQGNTTLSQMRRKPEELVEYLYRETSFPTGCILLTGTGIIPPDEFTLASGDLVEITIEPIGTLANSVE